VTVTWKALAPVVLLTFFAQKYRQSVVGFVSPALQGEGPSFTPPFTSTTAGVYVGDELEWASRISVSPRPPDAILAHKDADREDGAEKNGILLPIYVGEVSFQYLLFVLSTAPPALWRHRESCAAKVRSGPAASAAAPAHPAQSMPYRAVAILIGARPV
jgi:hypothetical protein